MKQSMKRKILNAVLGITLGLGMNFANSDAAQAQDVLLRAKSGQRVSEVGSRTLDGREGSVRLQIIGLDFDAGVFTLSGIWGSIPFRSMTVVDNPMGRLEFDVELIREEYPCLDLFHEKASLRVAPGATGDLVVLGATLSVETNSDSCHLTNKLASVEREAR